jgi:hypothetical protein
MRLSPLIALPVAGSLLAILTGCHLSRTPFPAPSIAAVGVSAGGILVAHLLIALGTKSSQIPHYLHHGSSTSLGSPSTCNVIQNPKTKPL